MKVIVWMNMLESEMTGTCGSSVFVVFPEILLYRLIQTHMSFN